MAEEIRRMRQKYDTTVNWASSNPTLAVSEFGVEEPVSGQLKLKIGDGVTAWNGLPYFGDVTSSVVEHIFTGSEDSYTFDVSSFSSAVSRLRIDGLLRSQAAAIEDTILIRLNADAGSNYDCSYYEVTATIGVFGSGLDGAATSSIRGPSIAAASGQASSASPFTIDIPYYKDTNFFKGLTGQAGNTKAVSPTDSQVKVSTFWGQRRNTEAITSVTFFTSSSSNLAAGSKIKVTGA